MNKFIEVTEIVGGTKVLISISDIMKIFPYRDNGSSIEFSGSSMNTKESPDEIKELMDLLLRDEFAMNAMNGILSNSSIDDLDASSVACDAYLFADAMLKERS